MVREQDTEIERERALLSCSEIIRGEVTNTFV